VARNPGVPKIGGFTDLGTSWVEKFPPVLKLAGWLAGWLVGWFFFSRKFVFPLRVFRAECFFERGSFFGGSVFSSECFSERVFSRASFLGCDNGKLGNDFWNSETQSPVLNRYYLQEIV
jgi:hypothetical protein